MEKMTACDFFFFQAEDGIRGGHVTGVQTCALPISLGQLVAAMTGDRREECPASDLILGHKCGGSDGLSGITANPLVGRIADRVTALGGGVILTEVPEMFGAERLLMNRAVDETVFRQIVTLIN